ncbi:MAG: hypothetical protein ACE5JI_18345, partial [Acidobacteriota bacterium]
YAQASLSPLLRAQIDAIKSWSKRRRLRILRYRPTTAKEHFCQGKRTRRALAEAMVRRYWFLASFLKHTHTPRTQEYWQQMFDAVALGVLAVADVTKGQGDRTLPRERAGGSASGRVPEPEAVVGEQQTS